MGRQTPQSDIRLLTIYRYPSSTYQQTREGAVDDCNLRRFRGPSFGRPDARRLGRIACDVRRLAGTGTTTAVPVAPAAGGPGFGPPGFPPFGGNPDVRPLGGPVRRRRRARRRRPRPRARPAAATCAPPRCSSSPRSRATATRSCRRSRSARRRVAPEPRLGLPGPAAARGRGPHPLRGERGPSALPSDGRRAGVRRRAPGRPAGPVGDLHRERQSTSTPRRVR